MSALSYLSKEFDLFNGATQIYSAKVVT